MTIDELCRQIQMDPEAERNLTFGRFTAEEIRSLALRLCDPKGYPAAAEELIASDDTGRGFLTLAVMLESACLAREKYRDLRISDEIYFDTMRAFSRFVGEYRRSYGCCGFDRGRWTGRQLSLTLFRLGTLEYELTEDEAGDAAVAVHIPSGADLSDRAVDSSLARAGDFLGGYAAFARWRDAPFCCDSWMLSPALRELLPPSSKILRFAARFRLESVRPESEEGLVWIFGRNDLPVSELPQKTSLQRAVKGLLERGGKLGAAFGVLSRAGR